MLFSGIVVLGSGSVIGGFFSTGYSSAAVLKYMASFSALKNLYDILGHYRSQYN